MKKKFKKLALGAVATVACLAVLFFLAYPTLENNYQRNMDPFRQRHAQRIAALVKEFADRTGQLPFQEEAAEKPFMVLIGHSDAEEDHFANDPVMKRDATWSNASTLEAVLSKGLGRTVRLPRDPQKVPTFAPNVYVYFVSGHQMSVVAHLKLPNRNAVKYDWHGEPFYAYTITYDFDPKSPHETMNTEESPQ